MGRRLDLQALLEDLIGSENVYFQPPENVSIQYPCIVYARDAALTLFADDIAYRHTQRYSVIVMDRDPDSDIPGKVAELPLCIFSRHYTSDNLHHDAYSLYF